MNEDDNQRRSEELRLQDEERRIAAVRNAAVTRIVQLVQFLTGAFGVLLLLRVVLRLFAANPNNQFAQVIYSLSILSSPRSPTSSETPYLVARLAFYNEPPCST